RAVEQRDLHIHDRIAGNDAGAAGLDHTLLDRWNEFARYRSAGDAIDKLHALAGFTRFELEPHVTVLAAATGLLDVLALGLDLAADGLAVRDLRLADVGLDLELALHAIDDDLEMQLAHAGDQRLPPLLVGRHAK